MFTGKGGLNICGDPSNGMELPFQNKEEKMKRLKKLLAFCLSAAVLLTSIPFGTAMGATREPEIVAGGYEIDMDDLPKVHFAEHPEWEELYDAAWESH